MAATAKVATVCGYCGMDLHVADQVVTKATRRSDHPANQGRLCTAYVYVCGDAARMARDVDETLQGIVAQQSGRSPKSAAAYLCAMSAEHRNVRDVY